MAYRIKAPNRALFMRRLKEQMAAGSKILSVHRKGNTYTIMFTDQDEPLRTSIGKLIDAYVSGREEVRGKTLPYVLERDYGELADEIARFLHCPTGKVLAPIHEWGAGAGRFHTNINAALAESILLRAYDF